MLGEYVDRGHTVLMCPCVAQCSHVGGGAGRECRVPRRVTILIVQMSTTENNRV